MRKQPCVGLCVLAHPLEEGHETAEQKLLEAGKALSSSTGIQWEIVPEVVDSEPKAFQAGTMLRKKAVDALLLLPVTWSDDSLAWRLWQSVRKPCVLWALPGIHTGSLCGCQQIRCWMKEMEIPSFFFFSDVDDPRLADRLSSLCRMASLASRLAEVRLALVGGRTPGMLEVTVDELGLREVFGVEVLHEEVSRFLSPAPAENPDRREQIEISIREKAGRIQASPESLRQYVDVFLRLDAYMEAHRVSAVAVDCCPNAMGTFCLAASLLASQGKYAACEADLHAALLALIVMDLTREAVHNTDLLHVYEEDNSALFSHCGSGAFSLARNSKEISLEPVRLMNQGCCVLFTPRSGPVTLVNLVGRKDTYRMCILEGVAVDEKMVFPGNPVRVRLPVSISSFLSSVADNGFGHHWVIGYGHVGELMREFGRSLGVSTVLLD